MSDGRRNELLVALNAEFPALFAFCYKVLEGNLTHVLTHVLTLVSLPGHRRFLITLT